MLFVGVHEMEYIIFLKVSSAIIKFSVKHTGF